MSDSETSSVDSGKQDFSNFIDLQNRVIGNYHLFYQLGKGSYAQVWLAYNHIKKDFYALKVQHPDDFDSARNELSVLKRIEKVPYKIEVKESFIFSMESKYKKNFKDKYYVIVFPVYGSNLEDLSKLEVFDNGFSKSIVKKFTMQTLENLRLLHEKYHLIHCDIKPDNFLLSYPDFKIRKIIENYDTDKFNKIYKKVLEKNPKLIEDKKKDMITRERLHLEIVKDIDFELILNSKITNEELLSQLNKSDFLISDFGDFCDIEEKYDDDFGTRYYRSPENILVSEELNYATDIWSLGCTIYELLTNKYLFDPEKCSKYTTDHYHLSEIIQLGKFSNKEIKSFQKRKIFFRKDKSMRSLPETDSVSKKFDFVKSDFWKKFIRSMLTVSYKKRPKSIELLNQLKSEQ